MLVFILVTASLSGIIIWFLVSCFYFFRNWSTFKTEDLVTKNDIWFGSVFVVGSSYLFDDLYQNSNTTYETATLRG